MIRLSEFNAFSSIVFIELKMKLDESNSANRKIFESWFSSSSNAPIPSESITSTFIGKPSDVDDSRVSDQTQRPLVQGFIVGPTPKPLLRLLRITLFKRKDLPVRYLPATAITAIFS